MTFIHMATMPTVAKAKKPCPRGWQTGWNPNGDTQALLISIGAVLKQYQAQLPLTIWQVFYRLVAAHSYPKDEHAYKRLCDVMNKARQAQLIPMQSIHDDGADWNRMHGYSSLADLQSTVDAFIDGAKFDPTTGQLVRQMVLCEAADMVPMLAQVAHGYGAPVMGQGGFASLTANHDLADRIEQDDRPVVVYHIGDHDPSGTHLFQSSAEDVSAFVDAGGCDVEWRRVAVTLAQQQQHSLPTAPAKTTDNRSFSGQTVQAEALPPNVLQQVLDTAAAADFDASIRAQLEQQFIEDRGEWRDQLEGKA